MKIIKKIASKDGKTTKYLQETSDEHLIETSYFNEEEHNICISTQIGCAMGCIFCAASNPKNNPKRSFIRNLKSIEIVQQIENVLKEIDKKTLKLKRILFCFMGTGEPLLNYRNIVKSLKTLEEKFPDSRATICTIGNSPRLMKKLAREKISLELKIHLSLHAPTDKLRKKILPKTRKIKSALEALKYFSNRKGVKSKVNYVLIKNLNDSEKNAKDLTKVLKKYPFTVKLSILNKNDAHRLMPSEEKSFSKFEEILNGKGIKTSRFFPDGTDIQGSCGQLRRCTQKE